MTADTSASALARNIDYRGRARRAALRSRLATVLNTLGVDHDPTDPAVRADPTAGTRSTASMTRALEDALAGGDPAELWLALSVLSGRYPTGAQMLAALRTARLDGPLRAVAGALSQPLLGLLDRGPRWKRVEVVVGEVLVDLQHTSQASFATGIQRVARQSARRWDADHDICLVGWSSRYTSLRRLSPSERDRALHGGTGELTPPAADAPILVPWRCQLVVPELGAEPPRTRSVASIGEYSNTTVSAVGFDCVPVTSAETCGDGMGGAFSLNLAALAKADRIAAISHGAADEYIGWRSMLRAAGIDGPQIAAVSLPVEAPQPDADALEQARARFRVPEHPLVLVVGSHEPRKNHLSVLHAAELLWRDGLRFQLVFVGGNSWNSAPFDERLAQLQAAGRPVESVAALSDELLWAAYRLARFTVFPSLNEGFGLPVAESLANGTPAITSGFGSMAEIAADGGALLVDPHDDHDIARAMRKLLTGDDLLERLREQALSRPKRGWDDYAAQLWHYLVADLRAEAASSAEAAPSAKAAPTTEAAPSTEADLTTEMRPAR